MRTELWWGETYGKWPLGRQRRRWKYNIKIYLRILGCELDWTGLESCSLLILVLLPESWHVSNFLQHFTILEWIKTMYSQWYMFYRSYLTSTTDAIHRFSISWSMALTGCTIRECPSSTFGSSTSFVTPYSTCFFHWNVNQVSVSKEIKKKICKGVISHSL